MEVVTTSPMITTVPELLTTVSLGIATGFALYVLFSLIGYSIYKFLRLIDDNK